MTDFADLQFTDEELNAYLIEHNSNGKISSGFSTDNYFLKDHCIQSLLELEKEFERSPIVKAVREYEKSFPFIAKEIEPTDDFNYYSEAIKNIKINSPKHEDYYYYVDNLAYEIKDKKKGEVIETTAGELSVLMHPSFLYEERERDDIFWFIFDLLDKGEIQSLDADDRRFFKHSTDKEKRSERADETPIDLEKVIKKIQVEYPDKYFGISLPGHGCLRFIEEDSCNLKERISRYKNKCSGQIKTKYS